MLWKYADSTVAVMQAVPVMHAFFLCQLGFPNNGINASDENVIISYSINMKSVPLDKGSNMILCQHSWV